MTPLTNRFAPRTSPTGLAIALLLASALALPPGAEAQRAVRRDGGGSAGGDSSAGSGRRNPAPSAPSGPSSSGGSSSGGSSSPTGESGSTASTPSGNGTSGGERSRRGSSDDVPTYSRPREGQTATGTAVARRGPPPSGGDTDIIYVPGGGYYPWGYGGFGFGGYYGSSYDPWYNDHPYYDPSYGGGQYDSGYHGDASLRIKVKPRDASVYADGYYVGRVDDFDGMFQRLHIESGPHRIEIRADGYDTLEFEVRLLPDRTLTYEGELRPRP